MNVTLDTNIIVRAVIQDDPKQAAIAARMLREADLVAIPSSCLCEFFWVLRRVYHLPSNKIATALRRLIASANVVTDKAAAEAGLWFLDRGGDFADGVIEYQGRYLGATTFASFDRQAVRVLEQAGLSAIVPR